MGRLNDEYKKFVEDIDKNITNKEDLLFIKQRLTTFVDVVIEEMESVLHFKEEKMNELEQKQKELDSKIYKMQQILDNIEKDIYTDEGFDFEIVCPYCNYEFVIDMDEEKTEVQCPECQNMIELDWSGNPDDEENFECNGSCSGCSGCDDIGETEEPQKPSSKSEEDDM